MVDEKQKAGIVSARDGGFQATTAVSWWPNIDGDTMVTPGRLDVVFEEFEKDSAAGLRLSGPYVYYDLNPWCSASWWAAFTGSPRSSTGSTRYILRVGSGSGSRRQFRAGSARTPGIRQRAGSTGRSKLYGEDTDVAVRLARQGKVKFTHRL